MLKRLLLSAVILSAVSVSSYAVDVNIPGADPSIPKDVYIQGVYSTEKIKNAYDVETRKIIDSIISKKGIPKGFGTAVNDDEVESFKNDLYSIKRRQFDGNTIVNLHNNDGGLSVTLPFSAIQKEAITDFPNSNAHYLVDSPMIAAGIIENKTPNTTEKTDVVFQYDGLSKSSLRKTTLRGAVEMEIIGLKFELSKHPNQEYNVILYPRATKLVTSNDINNEIRILNKIDNKSADLFGIPGARMITKGLHTYVWNDGIPGLLLDLELDNQQGILMFITYDENHKYINTIQYPLDNGVYSKAQLRKLITDVKLSSTSNLYAGDVWII
ncbi:MAG: hypothetical protein E7B83_09400 [Veillonella sp.]|uniref:hypothetical protein n=1 Tax=Veillonella sp. TaxID=1926307 RepID=UPI002900DC61|nr:hypothetical protein [Veillonella sp.]MDU2904257.1 hypothetical protein [Veillonella sp.]